MASPSEERQHRHDTKIQQKLAIDLYRSSYGGTDLYSLGVCTALKTKHPELANVFKQLEEAQYGKDNGGTVGESTR